MNDCTIIILGASGDLAKRKLFPALYMLMRTKRLANSAIIGAALENTSAEDIVAQAREHMRDVDEKSLTTFTSRVSYQQLNFSHEEDFTRLAHHIDSIEKKYGLSGNRIIYLATSASFYCSVTHSIAKAGIAQPNQAQSKVWNRIVYEKPFGHDATSAHQINECIAKYFDEMQIYRIDHYLTKELVSNIALIRFTNLIFEPLWNNRYIDNVQIIMNEKIGIEDRGAYYDQYGALKDMVQNHMLELVALIGMESPEMLTGEHIRAERAKVLAKVRLVDVMLGQYEGYRSEKNVAPDSKTDTFAALYVKIDNPRWAGVPFFLKTGKCLEKKETAIHIKFKQVDCLLTKSCPSDSNSLTIRIAPQPAFYISLNAKKHGTLDEVVPVQMELPKSYVFDASAPESYEVIFEELMRGEHSIAVRFDEIESAWKVIDAVHKSTAKLYSYEKGSTGPREIEDFAKKHGMRWRS